jgi:hypothetical protein
MSHNYLFDTYAYIHQRLTEIQGGLQQADDDPYEMSYAAGQERALSDFERFLMDNFHDKLPRRLRSIKPDRGDYHT